MKVNASYLRKENRVLVKVQDTGIGISKKDQQRLFKKFGKLQDVHKMNDKGVGLGLIICQQLCTAQNGKIWLSSREMEGSTFSFTLEMPPVHEFEEEGQSDGSGSDKMSIFDDSNHQLD